MVGILWNSGSFEGYTGQPVMNTRASFGQINMCLNMRMNSRGYDWKLDTRMCIGGDI